MAETSDNRHSIVKRLNRIEGQVKGVVRMLEEDRYCIDILHQIQA
ncbi:MAG: metal-sensitive transcriptional regulator, partial [Gammaproteobacteria bacterium]|nr:metal-sensitive transcriptional regulator [Gammaproteobacteria bacterium]